MKNEKITLTGKIFRQINALVFSYVTFTKFLQKICEQESAVLKNVKNYSHRQDISSNQLFSIFLRYFHEIFANKLSTRISVFGK